MTTLCNHEEAVVAAAINGHLDAPLTGHLESCESCRAAVAMISLLKSDEPCGRDITANALLPDIIWTKALYVVRQRRKRMRKLGVVVGVVFGVLAGYLTGIVAAPSSPVNSVSRAASVLSHSLPLLCPSALILLAVLLVFFANPVAGPDSRYRQAR